MTVRVHSNTEHYKLENRNVKPLKVTLPEIRQIVAENEKQRFSLLHFSVKLNEKNPSIANNSTEITNATKDDDDDADVSHYLIRANQGHSLAVSSEGLLTPITLEANNLPAMVVVNSGSPS